MSHIENTNYVCKDAPDADYLAINQSSTLDDLAAKIIPSYIQDICDVHVPKEGKSKARIAELLSVMAGVYKLLKSNGPHAPVFLVMDDYNPEHASGFYFFHGTEQEILEKLQKVAEDRYKLRENKHW